MPYKKFPLKFIEIIMLVVVWLVLIASPIFFTPEEGVNWQQLVKSMEILVPLFILFLINRLLLVPEFLFKGKRVLYLVSVAGLITVLSVGSYYLSGDQVRAFPNQRAADQGLRPPPPHFIPPDGDEPRPLRPEHRETIPRKGRGGRPIPPFVNFLIFSVLMVGFDTGIRVSFRLVKTERAKTKLEKEKLGSQLAFLRNQVSPHFFMNTLNNIHSLIDIDADEAKESIIRLSKLMRHLLYDSETEKIPIQKEMTFIKNYVDLMKLRFSDKVHIRLQLLDESQCTGKSIPPLLFTSFVENAFKHGISYRENSFIEIAFSVEENQLIFDIRNSNPNINNGAEPSGIGIENSKKRLDLLYKDSYSLLIQETRNEYTVHLSIPI